MNQEILQYPDPRLLMECSPVKEVTPKVAAIVSSMVDTMYSHAGAGLAAPQIGANLRIIVIDLLEGKGKRKRYTVVMINPFLFSQSGLIYSTEGCLSLPGMRNTILRSSFVEVEHLTSNGVMARTALACGPAVIAQHEIDHLDGILINDPRHQKGFKDEQGAS